MRVKFECIINKEDLDDPVILQMIVANKLTNDICKFLTGSVLAKKQNLEQQSTLSLDIHVCLTNGVVCE